MFFIYYVILYSEHSYTRRQLILAFRERGLPANEWSYIDKVLLKGFKARVSTHEWDAKWGAVQRLLGYEYLQHWTYTHSQVVTFSLARKPVNSTSQESPHSREAKWGNQFHGREIHIPRPNFPTASVNPSRPPQSYCFKIWLTLPHPYPTNVWHNKLIDQMNSRFHFNGVETYFLFFCLNWTIIFRSLCPPHSAVILS